MRIQTLNLQHGGGKRAKPLADYLCRTSADVLVLTEYRDNAAGAIIQSRLLEVPFTHWGTSGPALRQNGVAVAAKTNFVVLDHPPNALADSECRWLECEFSDFRLIAVYFPGDKPKLKYWQWFLPLAASRVDKPCVLVGDFNTGKHYIDEVGATFLGQDYMTEMEALGWVDAWRHLHPHERDFTWRSSRGNDFRLDYAWLARPFAGRLSAAEHDHTPRAGRISDHSSLHIDLAGGPYAS